jgi:excisionase family DNA binding protein
MQSHTLPILRFEISEDAQILRCSRAFLYQRIQSGQLKAQKDGARRHISAAELPRYVAACDVSSTPAP